MFMCILIQQFFQHDISIQKIKLLINITIITIIILINLNYK